ncbi:HNH endonuclease [Rathayibacter rathayi]|uniref:HNH endonuclease family protein n=1 Tax=Rathayibacter rathayi TaxID=33887 RepID=UPI000CE8E207|nr:HNH endonuclease family protein [Rathayibacter rathayi]PPG77468.1 HNH endonuclease [Rathayibacter rathayi]PPI65236.1 HNH endonuclease [Rathayibacter rathayi]
MKKAPLALTAALLGAVAVIAATQFGTGHTTPAPEQLSPTVSSSTSASLEAAGFAIVDDSGQVVVDAAAVETALDQVNTATQVATGYDRELFGQSWADVDRNGCDTRNDILARDLVDVGFKPGTRDCVVLTGVLHDTYTATTIKFERGEKSSQLVQIDHVVALSAAWQHGANTWTEQQREEFANDPINLQAVDGATNSSKSDSGPGEWMPPAQSYHCEYAARYVLVLTAYQLTVDDVDRSALTSTLDACGTR